MPVNMLPSPPYPDDSISHEWQPEVEVIKFGGGYSQRNVRGITPGNLSYTLKYQNLTKAERDIIYNFIVARKGSIGFGWKRLTDASAKIYICPEGIREVIKHDLFFDLEFTIEQVNDLDTIVP